MLYSEYLTKRRDYQIAGRDLLLFQKHACLFFEPGKGKTYPVIDAIREIDDMLGGKAKVLIISSPDAIRKMWDIDILPQKILPKQTYLVTDRRAIGEVSFALLDTKWDVIIVDECHIVKSNSSKIHKLVRKLSLHTEYVFGMTGTPRGNSDIDIWCQLQALNVGGQGRLSYTAWTQQFCTFETGWSAQGQFKKPVAIKEEYKDWWNNLLDTYCMFVDYEDDDNMPGLDVVETYIPYTPTEIYKKAIDGIISIGEFSTTTEKVVAISKAQQACNGYLYIPNADGTMHIERFDDNREKLRTAEYLTGDGRAVIVYKYIADLQSLQDYFIADSYTTDVDEFKRNPDKKYLFLQCGMCKSFNLQSSCSHIIFYTMDHSFIKYKQMIHRCWRIGQKNKCTVNILIMRNSIEEKIWNVVKGKQKVHDLYMSIKSAVR